MTIKTIMLSKKKPEAKYCILYDPSYLKCLEKVYLERPKAHHWLPGTWA